MIEQPSQAHLRIDDLSVTFGGLTALRAVTLDVAPGCICALIGPNGAGKTTLFNAITGFVRPSNGRVWLGDQQVLGRPIYEVAELGIARTFQNGGVFPQMTVVENVLVGLHRSTASRAFGIALGLDGDRAAERDAIERARAVLAEFGLERRAEDRAADLSFGEQRLVEVARAVVGAVRVVMLDEPAVGLTPIDRDRLVATMRRLVRQGLIVLLVEHSMDLVMEASDRVVVLNYGQILADGAPDAVRQDPAVLEAYLGLKN